MEMNPKKVKLCGLVIRVSTDIQALRKEGSLTQQRQFLEDFIAMKNKLLNEEWRIVEIYELRGISGKVSLESPELVKLKNDIKRGHINTVLALSIDRISRSSRDFLNFSHEIEEDGADLVCLKQQFDTTTPEGKLLRTVLSALAQFEREQTSGRFKLATYARAKKGLWNGGNLFGYDIDKTNKGHLLVNEREKAIVHMIYDTFMKTGSVKATVEVINKAGCQTKEYTSRRDIYHPQKNFTWSGILYILRNPAYLGKKVINKKNRNGENDVLPEEVQYKEFITSCWDPIMEYDKWSKVQALLKLNYNTKHNATKETKHNYLLNGGLLKCGNCNNSMKGGSGTSAKRARYYYYFCPGEGCKFRVSANEIENVIIQRLKFLAHREDMITIITNLTNELLNKEVPQLDNQKKFELRELEKTKKSIQRYIRELPSSNSTTKVFINQEIERLAEKIEYFKKNIYEIETKVSHIQSGELNKEQVIKALEKFGRIFSHLKPYEQKELIRLTLHEILLTTDKMKIALFGEPPRLGHSSGQCSDINPEVSNWYAREGSNLQPTAPEAVALSS